MKTNILIPAITLCCLLLEGETKANLSDILGKYCVPKSGEYCSNAFAAKYNANRNSCECKNTTYMRYNATNRNCEIQCPAGAVPVPVSSCPSGSYQIQIVDHS